MLESGVENPFNLDSNLKQLPLLETFDAQNAPTHIFTKNSEETEFFQKNREKRRNFMFFCNFFHFFCILT